MSILKALFGTKNDRDVKIMKPIVVQINAMEPQIQKLSDQELQAQTPKLREQYQRLMESGKSNYDALWEILPEAFATVREASVRVMKMRHFDVQLMGGIVLFQKRIAEMKTGEGKTLTATLPCYLHGISQLGAHVVTVNDYLASRDAREMGELYQWLGLSVGCILSNISDEERQQAYNCDITYGTNNEFAFDYLRDNMKFNLEDYVQQKGHNFCIVDEVDSILIDEARTPLLISGPSEGNTALYNVADQVVRKLEKGIHFKTDEKAHSAMFTDEGVQRVQEIMKLENLYSIQHSELLHHLYQSLKAHHLFKLDVNYVVKEGKVIIVDEFTGRLKEGSRWSDGLHQSVEAKEGVTIRSENQTLASITFQNYFKLYNYLAGMTGTAETEAEEFRKIYNLDVTSIPTNVPMIRDDQADVIYKSAQGKYKAIGTLIKELHAKGQPVLVGTISIENSELLSNVLRKEGIDHEVLNAKQHEREAEIVANAGHPGKVTIATNMAGRGTDIKLTPETKAAGGLYILGTERHESRRIDNQLRGRSGRQGDPGASKFFLSLEDDLMRIFGSDRIKGIMSTLGMEEDEPIEHRMITNAIAKAQKKVEAHNFEIRKHLLEYDNVMNEQRRVIYRIRKEILADNDNYGFAREMTEDVAIALAASYQPERKTSVDMWPWEEMEKGFAATFQTDYKVTSEECARGFESDPVNYFAATAAKLLEARFASYPEDQVKMAFKEILLSIFDQHWKDHLLAMDHVKEGINLRAYAQKDPLTEYKRESFNLFETMRQTVKKSAVETLFSVKLYSKEEIEELKKRQQAELDAQLAAHREAQARAESGGEAPKRSIARQVQKVGRNDPCPCGSGKKFKHCHGA